jgi:hypothetical protein
LFEVARREVSAHLVENLLKRYSILRKASRKSAFRQAQLPSHGGGTHLSVWKQWRYYVLHSGAEAAALSSPRIQGLVAHSIHEGVQVRIGLDDAKLRNALGKSYAIGRRAEGHVTAEKLPNESQVATAVMGERNLFRREVASGEVAA